MPWPSWTGAASSARDRSPSSWPARRSCSRSNALSPIEPALLVAATAVGADGTEVAADPTGLGITLPAGTGRDVIAEINRVLVEGGISVYRLQVIQASLESWFLAGHEPTWETRNDDVTDTSRHSAPLPRHGAPAPARRTTGDRGSLRVR